MDSPVDDKVCPEVAHHSGDLPVHGGEVEDAGGEEVDELVAVGHPSRDRRLLVGEEEVPEAGLPVMLKWIVVRVAVAKVVELHELVSWGLDEERSHHLRTIRWIWFHRSEIFLTLTSPSIILSQSPSSLLVKNLTGKQNKFKLSGWLLNIWTCSWSAHRWLRCHLWGQEPRGEWRRRGASENAHPSSQSLAPSKSCRSLQ